MDKMTGEQVELGSKYLAYSLDLVDDPVNF